jgi:transposase
MRATTEQPSAARLVFASADRVASDREGTRLTCNVAIDMCTIFKAAVRAALLVGDHFHLVQSVNVSVAEVRRWVTVQVRGRRGARATGGGNYATG